MPDALLLDGVVAVLLGQPAGAHGGLGPSLGILLGPKGGDAFAGWVHAVRAAANCLEGFPKAQVTKMTPNNLGCSSLLSPEEGYAVNVVCHVIKFSRNWPVRMS